MNTFETVKIILRIQNDILKETVAKALTHIHNDNEKAIFIIEIEKILLDKLVIMEKIEKELQ